MTTSDIVHTKTFTISSHDLGEDATLTFIFDVSESDKHKVYKDFCPVVWKVIAFSKTGYNGYTFEYSNKFSFVRPSFLQWHYPSPINGGGGPVMWQAVNPGQQIVLNRNNDGALQMIVGEQAASVSDVMEFVNKSGSKKDIVLGIPEKGKSIPRYLRVFPDIGNESSIQVKFTPVVQVYVTDRYEQAAVLMSPIDGKPIWSQNLDSLREETEWRLVCEPQSKTFKLQQVA